MAEALLQGLSITGLGMGLVFLMIIALWGIMALLVRLTNRPAEVVESEEAETQEILNTINRMYLRENLFTCNAIENEFLAALAAKLDLSDLTK